jgi:hypothetical protein
MHVRRRIRSLDRIIGRAVVMNAQYERSERMGSSQKAYTYIERREKIKNKPRAASDSPINKMIIAQMQ